MADGRRKDDEVQNSGNIRINRVIKLICLFFLMKEARGYSVHESKQNAMLKRELASLTCLSYLLKSFCISWIFFFVVNFHFFSLCISVWGVSTDQFQAHDSFLGYVQSTSTPIKGILLSVKVCFISVIYFILNFLLRLLPLCLHYQSVPLCCLLFPLGPQHWAHVLKSLSDNSQTYHM